MEFDEKECPYCAETIKAKAIKCRHCGELLSQPTRKRIECPHCCELVSANSGPCEHCDGDLSSPPVASSRPAEPSSAGCLTGCGVLSLFASLQGFSDSNNVGGGFWFAVGVLLIGAALHAGAPKNESEPETAAAPDSPATTNPAHVGTGTVVVSILLTLICSGFLYVYQRDYVLPGRDSQERAERAQAREKEEAYDKMMQRREDWGRQKEIEAKKRIEELKKHPDYPGKR